MRAAIHACCRARMLGAVVLLALLAASPSAQAKPKPLTKAEKERIDAAIKKGVDYLQRTQGKKGTWKQEVKPTVRDEGGNTRFGFDFLPGLALLECGVSASDPGIQKIAEILRKNQRGLDETCVLSLAILFLDRLGEAKNEALLQSLAVRLLAAQCREGGWGYYCPSVSPRNEKAILETLRKLWPSAPVRKTAPPARPSTEAEIPSSRTSAPASRNPSRSGSSPKDAMPAGRGSLPSGAAGLVPPHLRILTVFQSVRGVEAPKSKRPTYLDVAATENVATHFALMGLWTARRHGVPVDQSLRLLADYYQRCQFEDGNWPYRYRKGISVQPPPQSRNMIGIGLLGLATGHALQSDAEKSLQDIHDPRILKGFARMDREISPPKRGRTRFQVVSSLYFLWTVQQTAQAYGLETVGGKDWYRWGSNILIARQKPVGCWPMNASMSCSTTANTALALLFLKRYDPYRPLADRIRFDLKQLPK